jgi:plastocyanin
MMFKHGLFVAAFALTLTACGGNKSGDQAAQTGATGSSEQVAAAPLGGASISGTIAFTGAKPTPKKIQMSGDAYCKTQHATVDSEDVVVNPNGTLKNVYVYVKKGLEGKTFPKATGPAVLDQAGCMYSPHVLAAQTGQEIVIRNSDGVLHNVNARPKINKGFNFGQPVKGMESKKSFDKAEVMIPVKCDVHPWMGGYIGVQEHPYASVSGADGAFSLKGLPAGTYEIEAWHEKFGVASQTVTIGETETKTVNFSFKG